MGSCKILASNVFLAKFLYGIRFLAISRKGNVCSKDPAIINFLVKLLQGYHIFVRSLIHSKDCMLPQSVYTRSCNERVLHDLGFKQVPESIRRISVTSLFAAGLVSSQKGMNLCIKAVYSLVNRLFSLAYTEGMRKKLML